MWSPSDLDKYRPPGDGPTEPKKPKSTEIEIWRRNALNQSAMFSFLYENQSAADTPHLGRRMEAHEKLYHYRIRNTHKSPLKFPIATGPNLNCSRVEELNEHVRKLRLLRKVDRPTSAELRENGLHPDSTRDSVLLLLTPLIRTLFARVLADTHHVFFSAGYR